MISPNKDNLIDCPLCGEKAGCYSIKINETKNSYLCLGCGYQSSDLMKEGEYDVESYEQEMPELYKDMKKVDSAGRVWYPSVVNIQEKGTVFMNGTSAEDSRWSAITNIELTEEEKQKPVFKGKTHKSDSTSLKDFGNDYLSALEHIGIDF
jgi:DNA-directed RNA polymerase subunit RPC12/RpoP